MKKRMRTSFVALLSMLLILNTLLIAAVSAAPNSDITGHWAENVLTEWLSKGYLKGYSDGTLKPDSDIKRGEFITLVNRAFQLKGTADIHFTDISTTDWEYNEISTAAKAGYITGNPDGTVQAGKPITRQEASVMLASLLHLDSQVNPTFTDTQDIADWSKRAVGALAAKSIIKGYADGSFHPNDNMTRAEAVVLINQGMNFNSPEVKTYDQPGSFGPSTGIETIEGNVEINVAGVTLHNLNIKGDLLLAEGIGDGDVTLDHVTVDGKTTIRGGGENSIHVSNSVLLTVIVNKKDGTVRIVAEGTTSVKSVVIQSSAKLEESGTTGSGFTGVELSKELPADSRVTLHGTFDQVDVLATKISIDIPEGTIQKLNVDKSASSSTITVDQLASIMDLILDAAVKVLGQGTVDKVTANDGAAGTTFENKPTTIDGQAKDQVTTQAPASSVPNTSTPPGNNDTGNNNNNNNNNNENNNNENNPNNKSHNADLQNLSIGDLTLFQRDNRGNKGDAGFNPNVSYYIAETPIGFQTASVAINLEAADAKSNVSYGIYDTEDRTIPIKPFGLSDGTAYNLTLNPKTVLELNVTVIAEDGSTMKFYTINLTWEKTLIEKIRIDGFTKSVIIRGLSDGDKVRMYATADAVTSIVYGTSQNNYLSLNISNEFQNLAKPTGSIWFSLQKSNEDQEEARFEYTYDFTPIATPSISASGIEIRKLTEVELFNYISPGYTPKLGAIASVIFNQIDSSISSEVKYVHFYTHDASIQWMPTIEDLKGSSEDSFYAGKDSNGKKDWILTTSGLSVWDQYIYVYFYDAQKQPLGYYKQHFMETVPGAPILSDVTPVSILTGQTLNTTSNKAATLYLVPKGSHQSLSYLEFLVTQHMAIKVDAEANQSASIDTTDLQAGDYQIYAVDADGAFSLPSEVIIISAT